MTGTNVWAVWGVGLLLLMAVSVLAQGGSTGRITGAITDQTGGILAGATVSVTDTQRGATRTLTTDQAGAFNAPELTPGTYSVRAQYPGFKATERQNIVVEVGRVINLPQGFTLSINSSMISHSPVSANVPSIELPGTVASGSTEPLPGLSYNCLGISCGKSDLQNAVNNWNSTYAGTKDAKGHALPALALPSDYQFGDPTISQDFRLSKTFTVKERYKFEIFGEMFNSFNIANLTGYSYNLDTKSANPAAQTYAFGQPSQRAFQSFGSAGPRAVQVGGRFTF